MVENADRYTEHKIRGRWLNPLLGRLPMGEMAKQSAWASVACMLDPPKDAIVGTVTGLAT